MDGLSRCTYQMDLVDGLSWVFTLFAFYCSKHFQFLKKTEDCQGNKKHISTRSCNYLIKLIQKWNEINWKDLKNNEERFVWLISFLVVIGKNFKTRERKLLKKI